MLNEVVIVDAVRTPIGKYRGALASVRPDDLAAHVLKELLIRNPEISPAKIDDVMMGCVNQAGEDNRNVARMATLLAGFPDRVPGVTVNRLCGSGLEAVNQATATIAMGCADIVLAGGVESMTRAPLVMLKPEHGLAKGNQTLVDTTLGWRFVNPQLAMSYDPISMGETAEKVAEKYQISRHEQDEFAHLSQKKAKEAVQQNRFLEEMVPLTLTKRDGTDYEVRADEQPRPDTTLKKLASLSPAFDSQRGTVTAGNASGINDGASALLLMKKETAHALGIKPLVQVIHYAVTGVHPHYMGLGPVFAVRKLLSRTRYTIKDLDLIELNEAFAAQALACMRELRLDPKKVNINGGSIALGHPLGASGARILTTLIHEMKRSGKEIGLASMCIGVGQGIATLVKQIES
ncbi:thiolase family protein [Hazenella sp. IB182357]|uniref:acetyl-CoA C-acyltransferase n=1 Tax=Polycladospora coralii TaxID=2771432 RepID=A0A926NBB6_9BACL|nr:thiolase family protein [Polycladospora coralii]MBD1373047.1 thiolase family protein [Polycladospora coralii]MBS7529608.1 thiolase family protein [Polycladospora coralii]